MQAAGAAATSRLDELPDPTWRLILVHGLPQFVLEAVVPVVAFYVAWQAWGLGGGIVVSSVVSVAIAGWIVRRGGELAVVGMGVVFVAIQAAVGLLSQSATVYLAQPVVFSTLLAIAYIGSVVVGRPLIAVFASAWYPFPRWFRESAPFRREFSLQTLVWALYMLVRAGVRLWALLDGGVGNFVVVSLITGLPPYFLLVGWGIWHARRTFSRLSWPDGAELGTDRL